MIDRPYRIEACVETVKQALSAEQQGANQIELCSSLELDGLTPEKDLIESVINALGIHVKVLIRPRDGNFIYSNDEIQQMKKQVNICKKAGVREVVIGALNNKNELDIATLRILAELAGPMEVSLHKCLDFCTDPIKAIEDIKSLGKFKSILSSGASQTAQEGVGILKKMIAVCGEKVEIIPAGKITPNNIDEVHELLNANTYHGRNILGDLEN